MLGLKLIHVNKRGPVRHASIIPQGSIILDLPVQKVLEGILYCQNNL